MRRRSGLALLIVLVSLLSSDGWLSAADRCNSTADNLLAKVKSWPDLHRWLKGYADCDDGDLTDDVVELVTSSLAKDWKDFPQLEQEIIAGSDYSGGLFYSLTGAVMPCGPPPGSSQSAPNRASTALILGTAAPAAKVS